MVQKEECVSARSQFTPESVHRNIGDFEIFVAPIVDASARDNMDYETFVIGCDNST